MRIRSLPTLAVIGCGDWGKNIVRTTHAMDVLGAICDVGQGETARHYKKKHQIPLKSFEDIVADVSIDGVIIATPTASHFSLAQKALEAGKHVLVEKPMVTTLKENEQLDQLARERGLTLMAGHLLLYHSGFLLLEEMVKNGKIGDVQYVSAHRFNFGKMLASENVLWDLGPHDLSMVLALLGQPEKVLASEADYVTEGIGDTCTLHLTYPNNHRATIALSRIHPFKEHRLVVGGTKGMLVFDDTKEWHEKVCFYPCYVDTSNGSLDVVRQTGEYIELPPTEPLRQEIEHFLKRIVSREQVRSSAKNAKEILSVILAAEASIKTHHAVTI